MTAIGTRPGPRTSAGIGSVAPTRLRSIDCLRGIAALGVLASHAMRSAPPPEGHRWYQLLFAITGYGSLGVPLFFAISGFCIHRRWAQDAAAGGSPVLQYGPFWRRRLLRLYPPYLAALCLSTGLAAVAMALGRPMATAYPENTPGWLAADFGAHLFMLHGLHPAFDQSGGNPVYWTLAREEYLYLLYLPLLAIRRRAGMIVVTAGVVILGLAFPYFFAPFVGPSPWWGIITSSAIVLWIQWVLGAVAAEADVGLLRLPVWLRSGWSVIGWALVGVAIETAQPSLAVLVLSRAGVFFVLLNYCVGRERRGRWPAGRAAGWLAGVGLFSYSLYLIHYPVQVVLTYVALQVVQVDEPIAHFTLAVGLGVAGYAAGRIFFRAVERRFLYAGRGRMLKQDPGRAEEALP